MKGNKTRNGKTKLIYSVIFLLLLVAVTLIYLLKDMELSLLKEIFESVNKRFVLQSVVMVILYLLLGAIALKATMKSLKEKIKYRQSFVYLSIDFFFSGITPSASGGQPLQIYYMKKDGYPIHKSTIATLLYTIVFKIVLIFLSLLSLILFPEILEEADVLGKILYIVGIIINIIIIAICFMGMYWKSLIQKTGYFILNKLAKFKLVKNLEKKKSSFDLKLNKYNKSAMYLKENKTIGIKLFFIILVQRICLFSVIFFVYRSFGYDSLSIYYLLAIQIIVSIAVDSMPFPGGAGLSEILLTTLLSLVYPGEKVLTCALLLTRGVNFYFALIFTGLITFVNHIILMKKNKENKVNIEDAFKEEVV